MNYLRTLIAVLFCAMILPANAQDKDCFADLENELSSILKKDSKSSRILKIGSKSSRIPRKVVRWNREKICKQFNMIFANMCQSDFISSDTIIVVRKSQEYLYIGEDKAFFAVKCLPNQRQYRFLIINTARKDTIINKDINSFDRFSCIINLALKNSSELLNKNNFGTVFTDDLYLYSICMIIRRRDDLFHINYYRTLGQEIFLQNKDAYPQEHSF